MKRGAADSAKPFRHGRKKRLLTALGLLLAVLPPAVATLECFPLWVERGGTRILSGCAVLLLICAARPICRFVRRRFDSPAAWVFWGVLWVALLCLRQIVDELYCIALVGMLSNIAAAICFEIARRGEETQNGV